MSEAAAEKLGGRRAVILAAAVFFLALVFRLCGIGWGLHNELHNASYHPDEPIVFTNSQMIVPGLGRFVPKQEIPHFYSYGTLYLTLLRVASDIVTTYTGAPQTTPNAGIFQVDWSWISRCHLAGRFISCVAGAGTAWIVCLMLIRRVGEIAGGAGGLLVAVAPAHVLHSRFQTVDVLATFFLAVSLYYSTQISGLGWEPDRPKSSNLMRLTLLAGLFAGLSAGTKYTGILALAGLIAALGIVERRRAIVPVIAGVATGLLAFVVTTPGVVLQQAAFIKDFMYEMVHTSTGHGLVFTGTGNGFVYTLNNLLIGMGPLPVLVGLGALAYAAYRKHQWAWVLIVFAAPYFFLIGRSEVKFVRYSFPLYVGIAAGFGYAVQVCHRRGGVARVGVGVAILGLGGVPFGGLATASAFTSSMMGEDPRDSAARYLKTQAGQVGLAHSPWFWTAALFPDAADPSYVPLSYKLAKAQADSRPPIALVVDDSGQAPGWSMDLLSKQNPSLVSFSSFEYFPILRLKDRKDLGEQQPEVDSANNFLDFLKKNWTIDQQFGSPNVGGASPELLPEDLLYTSPVIYVWKKKQ